MNKKISSKTISLIFGISVLLFCCAFLVFAWTEPSVSPPGGNVPAPINTGSSSQTKTGDLVIPNLYLNATGNEGNIYRINQLIGYNDIFIKGNSLETAPVYIAGSQVSFYTGGAERIRITSGGNVGIGTTNPDNKLEVNGSIEIQVDDADNKLRFHDPGQYWYSVGIDRSDSGKFKINRGGNIGDNNDFTLTTGGNVGIGTTNPTQKLDVVGYVKGRSGLCIGDVCKSSWSEVSAIPDDLYIKRLYLKRGTNNWLAIGDELTDDWLRVNRDQSFGGIAMYKPVAIGTGGLAVGSWDRLAKGEAKFTYSGGYTTIKDYSGVQVYNPEGTTGQVRLGAAWGKPGVYSSGALYLFSDTTGVYIGDSNSEKMFVRADGNVGIGTTNPGSYRLYVSGGNVYFSNDLTIGGGDIDMIKGQTSRIHSLGEISFDWTTGGTYDYPQYHGIQSKNESGSWNDDLRINSYDNIINTLDSNNNNSTSYFKIQHHSYANGEDLFWVRSADGNAWLKGGIESYYWRPKGTNDGRIIRIGGQIRYDADDNWYWYSIWDSHNEMTLHYRNGLWLRGNLTLNNTNISGVDKISANIIDPVYKIDGEKYVTYVPDMIGLKAEIVGEGQTKDGKLIIDLAEQKEGSDLWLFWNIVKHDSIIPFVSPQSAADLYAYMDGSKLVVEVREGDKNAKFSYRLVGTRLDYEDSDNLLKDETVSNYIDIDSLRK
jgi:hypothetical protein